MSKIKENVITLMLVSAMVLFIIGCSALAPAPEQVLKTRISELAQAKVKGDWGKVYDYYSSGFKSKIKKEEFLRGHKVAFNSFTIGKINLAEDNQTADVQVKYDAVVNGYDLSGMPENQHWIKEDGKWVLDVKPTKGFI